MTLVCGDSHTCTHGGLGALAFGIGATRSGARAGDADPAADASRRRMRISFNGKLAPGVTAKDMILATIGQIGTGGGRGHAVEYAGDAIRAHDGR